MVLRQRAVNAVPRTCAIRVVNDQNMERAVREMPHVADVRERNIVRVAAVDRQDVTLQIGVSAAEFGTASSDEPLTIWSRWSAFLRPNASASLPRRNFSPRAA